MIREDGKRPIDRLCELLEKHDVTHRKLDEDTVRYVTKYGIVVACEENGSLFAYYADADGIWLTPEQAYMLTVMPDRDAMRKRTTRLLVELDEAAGLALHSYLSDSKGSSADYAHAFNRLREVLRELDTPMRGEEP